MILAACDEQTARRTSGSSASDTALSNGDEPRNCGSDITPSIEIGRSLDPFQPFTEPASLLLERGPQGLQHVGVALRGAGIERRASDYVLAHFTISKDGDDLADSDQLVRLRCVGIEQQALDVRVVTDGGLSDGDLIELTVTLVDELDVEISDSVQVELWM